MAGQIRLKRELGLFEATVYGIGIILGAGIYAIIGEGAGLAGNMLWLSFIIAAIVAAFTGLSYAELSSMFPRAAAEYNYTKEAFRRRDLSFVVGWLVIVVGIIAGATVSLGFAGYFSFLFGTPIVPVAIAVIIIFSLINFIGIKESARFNILSTVIEFSGLLLIIVAGAGFIGSPGINYLEAPAGMPGVLSAAVLIFFAFIGFEYVANISEETRNASRVIPKALLIALFISTALYILVSLSAVSVTGWQGLAASPGPLTSVAVTALGPGMLWIFSVIALFATGNTALIMFIVVSRMLYGMARDRSLPPVLSRLHHRRRTPWVAILLVMAAAALFSLIGSIKTVAFLTGISIFVAYLFVNLAVIRLRFSRPEGRRPFRIPGSIGRVPLVPVLGVLTCAFMLFQFDLMIVLAEMAVIITGYLVYLGLRGRISKW